MNANLAYVQTVYSVVDPANGKNRWGDVVVNYRYPAIGQEYTKVTFMGEDGKTLKEVFVESPRCTLNMIDEYRASYEKHGRIEVRVPQKRYNEEDVKLLVQLIGMKETKEEFNPNKIKIQPYGE